mmetsp:Transcript_25277/g.84412  ORF Transcript_25277/g.84412 Transcript_25277/m.84412 type:complete len:287 (-) Transcript_25277:66-926(-)
MGIVCSGRLPTRSLATPRSTCNLEGNVAIIFTSMPRSSKCSTPTTTRTRRRSSITSSGCAVREFGGHNSNSRRCAKNTRLMRLFTKRACPPMRWSWQRWRLAAFSCPTTTASTTTASALHPTWHGVRRQSFCPCGRSAAPRPRVERKVRLSTESVSSCPQILPPPPLSSARRLRALPETLWLQQRPCLEERSAMHRRTLATPLRPRARPLVSVPPTATATGPPRVPPRRRLTALRRHRGRRNGAIENERNRLPKTVGGRRAMRGRPPPPLKTPVPMGHPVRLSCRC